MITTYLSDKIKVLSLVAIILVLYIHSGFHDYPHEILGMEFNHVLQSVISGKLGRCAVPLFFMISGFLFFQHVESVADVWSKMRKRVNTLLIPYFIAALFFPLFGLLIEQIPYAAKMSNGGGSSNEFMKPVGELLCCLFYKKPGGTTPWAFHLWYLRDLIIIVACSPVLFYMRRYLRSEGASLAFFALSCIGTGSVPFSSFFWFMAGDAWLSRLDKIKPWIWITGYALIVVVEMMVDGDYSECWRLLLTFVGVGAIWSTYDVAVGTSFSLKEHGYLSVACSFTCFIYLFHEPALNIVRKLLIIPLGRSSLGFAVNYLVSPWIFAACFILLGGWLKKYFPRVYAVCVGGR